jgi:hypothetical protein
MKTKKENDNKNPNIKGQRDKKKTQNQGERAKISNRKKAIKDDNQFPHDMTPQVVQLF